MKVAVLPHFFAVIFAQYLYQRTLSAIFVSVSYRMSTSVWPPVATSWWCTSIRTPTDSSASTMSDRMSWNLSIGGAREEARLFPRLLSRVGAPPPPPLPPLPQTPPPAVLLYTP